MRLPSNPALGLAGVFALVLAILLGIRFIGASGTAPVPPMFDLATTLEMAEQQASQQKKLVFAYATAEWCGPCQQFKRGALMDARVERWVREHTIPVYVDVDARPAEASRLGVRSIPAVRLLRGGRLILVADGVVGADELLARLERAAALPGPQQPGAALSPDLPPSRLRAAARSSSGRAAFCVSQRCGEPGRVRGVPVSTCVIHASMLQ